MRQAAEEGTGAGPPGQQYRSLWLILLSVLLLTQIHTYCHNTDT